MAPVYTVRSAVSQKKKTEPATGTQKKDFCSHEKGGNI